MFEEILFFKTRRLRPEKAHRVLDLQRRYLANYALPKSETARNGEPAEFPGGTLRSYVEEVQGTATFNLDALVFLVFECALSHTKTNLKIKLEKSILCTY